MDEAKHILGLLLSNPQDQRLLVGFLEELEYKVIPITNVNIQTIRPLSLVITDENFGKRYSKDFLHLKKELTPLFIPILILVGLHGNQSSWLRMGFNEVVKLPLSKMELASKIKVLMRLREESENQFKTIFENINVGIYRMTLDHSILQANPSFLHILGYENITDIKNKKLTELNIFSENDREFFMETLKNHHKVMALESKWTKKDGSIVWIRENAFLYQDPTTYKFYYHGTIEDVTQQKKLEETLKDTENKLNQLMEHSPYGILIELDGKIVSLNKAMMEIFQVTSSSQIIGKVFLDFVHPDFRQIVKSRLHLVLEKQEILENLQEKFLDIYNNPVDVEVITCPFSYKNHRAVLQLVNNISNKVKTNYSENSLNYFDDLTGLPNRCKVEENLLEAISYAKKFNEYLAVLIIDIDGYKKLSTQYGFTQAEKILQKIALRFQKIIQYEDILGRLSTDQFIIIANNVTDINHEPARLAEKILNCITEPFIINDNQVCITACIGISIYPFNGIDAPSLFSNADIAMYTAKQKGRNIYLFAKSNLTNKFYSRSSLETQLRNAISNGDFHLHYQPKLCLHSQKIKGVEALLRWEHPEQGYIPPEKFIPIAEETGLIVPLTEVAFQLTCQQMKDSMITNSTSMVIALNLSVLSLQEKKLFSIIKSVLKEVNLDSRFIELEITESRLMQDINKNIPILKKFKNAGFKIAIDDFGTGYSSLNYLKNISFDTLKIDKSFIRDILLDTNDAAIVDAIISMAHHLNLSVVAEGVENREQLLYLKDRGCNEIQGYYFSKPLTSKELSKFLQEYPKKISDFF